MTIDEILKLVDDGEALEKGATAGPWFSIRHPVYSGSSSRVGRSPDEPWENFNQIAYMANCNADFSADARTRLPACYAAIRELVAMVKTLEADSACMDEGEEHELILSMRKDCERHVLRIRKLEADAKEVARVEKLLLKSYEKIDALLVLLREAREFEDETEDWSGDRVDIKLPDDLLAKIDAVLGVKQ
jgi:hypothetical protein